MKPTLATQIITAFENRFGQPHLDLAYHAAFPMALTSDLVYRLWANFRCDCGGQLLNIPWVAVADLILSSLCEEVGHDLYEIAPRLRQELLRALEADNRFGTVRIQELAEFTLDYTEMQLNKSDPMEREYAQVQRWGSLATLQPKQAARELAQALSSAYREDLADLNRMATVVLNLADPLHDYPSLLTYARLMERYARGDKAGTISYIQNFYTSKVEVEIEGAKLIARDIHFNITTPKQQFFPTLKRGRTQFFLGILSLVILLGGTDLIFRLRVRILLNNDLASQISSEISGRIEERVRSYTNQTGLLLEVSRSAIESGVWDLNDFSSLERHFWNQLQSFEWISAIYFANDQGEFVGVQRRDQESFVLWLMQQADAPERKTYRLDSQGERAELLDTQMYDPRTRPWFQTAVYSGKPTWSPIYQFASHNYAHLGITPAVAIYSEANELQGVLAIDLPLSPISDFLRQLEISPSGQAFIIERSGEIGVMQAKLQRGAISEG